MQGAKTLRKVCGRTLEAEQEHEEDHEGRGIREVAVMANGRQEMSFQSLKKIRTGV